MVSGAANHPESGHAATARFKRAHFAPANAFAPPANEMEHQLTALWEAVLNIEGLGIDDDFFAVGGESFAAVTLFTEMERFLGEMPPLSILLDYPTIRRLALFLDQPGAATGSGLVIPLRAQGQRLPLFSAHAAHGNVLFVRQLLPFLSDEQRMYAIRARGLHKGEAPHRSFDSMTADYVEEIRRIQPQGPYVLTGHCIGGIIAFEMAQRLKVEGHDVAAVIMIDPEYHPNAVPWLYWRDPAALQVRLRLTILRPIWFVRRWLHRVRDRLAGRPVVEHRTETGENRQRQNAVIEGLGAALHAYRPKRYDGKVVILCSAERRGYLGNAPIGWHSLAPDVEFIEISGSHDEVFFNALPAVGKTLEGILARFESASPPPLQRVAAE